MGALSLWEASLGTVMLALSCTMMVIAWYLHLKFENLHLFFAILISWGIAFLEYCFQVPANRIGTAGGLQVAQMRAIAELFTLLAFIVFNVSVLKNPLLWNHIVGFNIVLFGVYIVLFGPFTSEVV